MSRGGRFEGPVMALGKASRLGLAATTLNDGHAHARTSTHTNMHMHTHAHGHIHSHTRTHARTHTHTHTHMHAHARTPAGTQLHTRTRPRFSKHTLCACVPQYPLHTRLQSPETLTQERCGSELQSEALAFRSTVISKSRAAGGGGVALRRPTVRQPVSTERVCTPTCLFMVVPQFGDRLGVRACRHLPLGADGAAPPPPKSRLRSLCPLTSNVHRVTVTTIVGGYEFPADMAPPR